MTNLTNFTNLTTLTSTTTATATATAATTTTPTTPTPPTTTTSTTTTTTTRQLQLQLGLQLQQLQLQQQQQLLQQQLLLLHDSYNNNNYNYNNYNYNYKTTTSTTIWLQLHYTNYITPQLQLHYATTTTTVAVHHTTSSSCGWGDHCNHCNHSSKHNSNHLSVNQWIRSAIRDWQQPTSPIGFLFWNFRHRLVRYYWYICIIWLHHSSTSLFKGSQNAVPLIFYLNMVSLAHPEISRICKWSADGFCFHVFSMFFHVFSIIPWAFRLHQAAARGPFRRFGSWAQRNAVVIRSVWTAFFFKGICRICS